MDFLTTKQRSQLMSHVRAKNTKPELIVRRIVRKLGFRFKTYQSNLPAKPDLVFPSVNKVILVHGCFWHRHRHCRKATTPKTRAAFWRRKFRDNQQRDKAKLRALQKSGWKSLVLWECETQSPNLLEDRIRYYLEDE